MSANDAWPELPYAEWAPTKKTLQMCCQMLGKARLALAPPLPEWLHTCLYLDAHGFTTGPMPHGSRVITLDLDVFRSEIRVALSDGRSEAIGIGSDRCVADVWGELGAAFGRLGLSVDIWEKPQEVADTTPFSANRHDCVLVPAHAQRFHRVLTSVHEVFEEFRSDFFGRTSVQFWWGAFDYAVLLFNGRHATAPDDRGYIMRYDLDAEHLNAGFWPGDDDAPTPGFYAYLVPQPAGCEHASIEPHHAGWVESMGEWMMDYESVRTCDDPRQAVADFLASVYRFATTQPGWPASEFEYTKPAEVVRD